MPLPEPERMEAQLPPDEKIKNENWALLRFFFCCFWPKINQNFELKN